MDGKVLLTLGHGYAASAFAASLTGGWSVLATTRSVEKADMLRTTGITPVDAGDRRAMQAAMDRATHILMSMPPGEAGDPVLAHYGAELDGRWLGYLSTTGVYGDHEGGWVDETSPLAPVNARSRWRVLAEEGWRARGAEIFRLAGIYGLGRSAFDRLRAGRARRVIKPGQVFSRIHVEDIAMAIGAAIADPDPGQIVNLADDLPAPPQDVIVFAARLLGMQPPPEVAFEAANLSPMARSFYAESKRVSNRKLRERLGVKLAYPDFRAGLRAIMAQENARRSATLG